tara:strand:+ start:3130 stop:3453 length:324 start_codon:yes stop_codon:yes gene_type:complete
MNPFDITLLEKEFQIKLPAFYVDTMFNIPFEEDSFAAEFTLSNDVHRLIYTNGVFKKNGDRFAIGSDGGEHIYFIKHNGEETVYLFDLEGSDDQNTIEATSWQEYLD